MRIDIWSDVVCPWCFIGKRRLEKALETFPHPVEIVYHSYQLDPGAPLVPTETVAESLGKKYGGGPVAGQKMVEQVEAVAAEEGLLFRLGAAQRANTVDAHRLLHLALAEGVQGELKEELLSAYFLRAENPADHDVLRKAAATVGLDPARVEEVLAGTEYRDAVEADIEQARDFGAGGVPFFVVDHRYAISGAQPAEVFSQALERAWSDSHPTLTTLPGAAEACGPDGCEVPGSNG